MEKLTTYLKRHPYIKTAQARTLGISPVELKRWCDKGSIHRLSRGYYGLETLSSMAPQIVAMIPQPCAMAGISALIEYGYTNAIGHEVWVLVPEGLPPINRPGVCTMRQKNEHFKIGLVTMNTQWGPIKITDREKSVLDALRGKYLDIEEKLRVIKRWRLDPKGERSKFNEYSMKIKVPKSMRDWLMVLEAGA